MFRFLIFVTVVLCFIRLFFRRLHRILVIFKYVFIYLCISILSAFNYLKGCSLLLRFQWLEGGDAPGRLYIFLCHQLVGIRNGFSRTFSLFSGLHFSVLCLYFRKVICIEFSLFHDFVGILFIGFGIRVFPPFLSHLSFFPFLIIRKMLFYCLKIAETNREVIFDTPLLYLCDKALILKKLWIFSFSFTFKKYKNLSLFCRTLLLLIFVLTMIISELYYFIEFLKNIPILSLNAPKAWYF